MFSKWFGRGKSRKPAASRSRVRLLAEQLEGRELKTTAMDIGLGIETDPPTLAAAYIKFDGVDGESQDARGGDHDKWSDLDWFTTGPQATRAAYIKFDGVDGESQDAGDKDRGRWSDLASFTTAPQAKRAAYIKFDGVDGESQDAGDKDHNKWSDIESFGNASR